MIKVTTIPVLMIIMTMHLMTIMTKPVVRVRVESNHIVVAVNGQVRLPLGNNAHDTVDDKC